MGRTHSALAQHHPLETLAQWLESLRQRSGMSWSQMARTVMEKGLSPSESTLYRAAQGRTVPKWKTVQAFTLACGGSEREAKRLWTRADRGAATRPSGPRRAVAVAPQFIIEPWQLIHAMDHLRRQHDNPTLRELEARAMVRGVSFLPKSTVGAVLQGRVPAKELLLDFVRHCCSGATDEELQHWAGAWERVNAYRKGELQPVAREARQELSRLEGELRRTRRQLEQATVELARSGHRPTAVGLPRRSVELVPSAARQERSASYRAGPSPQVKVQGARRPLHVA